MVEELDMRFRLHDEIGFKSGTLGKERYVAVKNIYLLALLGHERHATPHGEPADGGATYYGCHYRHHCEPCFLFKGFYQHDNLVSRLRGMFQISSCLCAD